MDIETEVDFENVDQIITILQRNGWKAELLLNHPNGIPAIKAEHEKANRKILLLPLASEAYNEASSNLALSENLKSFESFYNLNGFIKYLTCLVSTNGSKQILLKEVI